MQIDVAMKYAQISMKNSNSSLASYMKVAYIMDIELDLSMQPNAL